MVTNSLRRFNEHFIEQFWNIVQDSQKQKDIISVAEMTNIHQIFIPGSFHSEKAEAEPAAASQREVVCPGLPATTPAAPSHSLKGARARCTHTTFRSVSIWKSIPGRLSLLQARRQTQEMGGFDDPQEGRGNLLKRLQDAELPWLARLLRDGSLSTVFKLLHLGIFFLWQCDLSPG